MDIFAKRLTEALKANGMLQSELARRLNLSHDSVNNYCHGRNLPSVKILIKICNILDESADYLLGLKN